MQASAPKYETPCGWNSLLPVRRPENSAPDRQKFDVVIVGAGYTGLATARRWAQLAPGARIALIDATTVGEGNPGRNSGFLLEISLANDVDTDNMARMRECNVLLGDAMQSIRDDVAAAGIDCGLQRSGTFRAAAGAEGEAALDRYRRFLDASDLPCQELDRDTLASRIGTRFYRRGLYSPHCYLVQPAALVRGLIELLPDNVTLYEQQPAQALRRSGSGWRIDVAGGHFQADKVVLANNAFCKNLGVGKSRIVAMYTYAALTEPLPPGVPGGTESSWGLLPAHRLGSTLRRTADNRLLIRSRYGYEREANNATIARTLQDALRRRFPDLPDVPFASVWSGATGFTYNGAPLWGETAPGLFVSAGCNGGGVVKGTLLGRLLADRANGIETPDVKRLFGMASWMPPEPLRAIGFHLIAGIERRRARAEV